MPAPANTRDHTLLPLALDSFDALADDLDLDVRRPTLSLDAGYDYAPVHTDLDARGITAKIAERGEKTSIHTDGRWVVERTNYWMDNFGKLRRRTERRRVRVEFYLALAAAIVTLRSLIRRAWFLYRWDTHPRSPRIR